jgi:hypothetical protein
VAPYASAKKSQIQAMNRAANVNIPPHSRERQRALYLEHPDTCAELIRPGVARDHRGRRLLLESGLVVC